MKHKDRKIDSPRRSVTVSERAVKYDINVHVILRAVSCSSTRVEALAVTC